MTAGILGTIVHFKFIILHSVFELKKKKRQQGVSVRKLISFYVVWFVFH